MMNTRSFMQKRLTVKCIEDRQYRIWRKQGKELNLELLMERRSRKLKMSINLRKLLLRMQRRRRK